MAITANGKSLIKQNLFQCSLLAPDYFLQGRFKNASLHSPIYYQTS